MVVGQKGSQAGSGTCFPLAIGGVKKMTQHLPDSEHPFSLLLPKICPFRYLLLQIELDLHTVYQFALNVHSHRYNTWKPASGNAGVLECEHMVRINVLLICRSPSFTILSIAFLPIKDDRLTFSLSSCCSSSSCAPLFP